jgi:hypothetical protein
MDIKSIAELKFSGPAKYRLIIKGYVPQGRQDLFGSLKITEDSGTDFKTIMEGEFLDQAQLAGVINTLYSLRLPLVEVQYIEPLS